MNALKAGRYGEWNIVSLPSIWQDGSRRVYSMFCSKMAIVNERDIGDL